MKVTLNKTDNVNGIIAIELEKNDYQENVDKSLNQFRQRANIPGFRPGRVPKGIIQKMYGKSILADEINKLVSNELYNYIKDNGLNILGEPLPNEEEQKTIDFDKDENFEFKFDIALAPEFELPLNKRDSLTYYNVKVEDDLLDKQIDAYKQNYGTYKQVESEVADTDLIKGKITEIDNGEPKENLIEVENGMIMPSYIKDEEIRKQFVGAKVGDTIVFSPAKAYDNNAVEIASLLQISKEDVAHVNSDFSFEIREVTRYEEATMNQELFDKVLGEGVVSTEEEFRTKIAELLSSQFKPAADSLFMKAARELVLKKMKGVEFPDAFLKRWLLVANEKNSPETIEEDYPKICDDLKFHLSKEKIVKDQQIKVEKEEMEAFAAEVARSQFAQYGMSNVPADVLENYVKRMLEDQNTVRNMYDQLIENKVMEWLKQTVKVNEKEILSKDFEKLFSEEKEEK
ncbi:MULTISPECIES: trigger factor [Petrimonas]|jgi:trigger factor|uniref:trigger factor n=1 Tax=Petrimonas TaxID=307628 RepID=UPI0008EF874E|nr:MULTISPECIES: trigger factor [Petrimonas]MDD3560630.1 trigger factor [Petrimonas mucosa]SFU27160.1 trigger factor [Porphyromonadaceae bacterium KHP3R9]HHT30319.1 trigger factor [Petrimonas mucosa]